MGRKKGARPLYHPTPPPPRPKRQVNTPNFRRRAGERTPVFSYDARPRSPPRLRLASELHPALARQAGRVSHACRAPCSRLAGNGSMYAHHVTSVTRVLRRPSHLTQPQSPRSRITSRRSHGERGHRIHITPTKGTRTRLCYYVKRKRKKGTAKPRPLPGITETYRDVNK